MIYEFFLTGLLFLLLVLVWQHQGIYSAVTFFAGSSFISCNILLLTQVFHLNFYDFRVENIWFSAMPMHNLSPFVIQTLHYFLFLQMLCAASLIGIPSSRKTSHREDSKINFWELSLLDFRSLQIFQGGVFVLGVSIAALFAIIMSFLHFFSLDEELLYQNTVYLTITSPYKMGLENPILIMYHSLYRLVGLVAGPFGLIFLFARRPAIGFMFLLLWLYATGMSIVSASRFSSLYFFSIGVILIVLRRSYILKLTGVIFIIIGIFSLMFAIESRSNSVYGVAMLTENLYNFNYYLFLDYSYFLLFNAFEGALNVANSIKLSPEFSNRYQVLSFSPLVSAIDGFEDIRDADRAKFAQFVPMGSFGEIYSFKIYFQITYFWSLYFTFRYAAAAKVKLHGLSFLLLTVFLVYVFQLLPNYSLRTTWRFIFIFGILFPFARALWYILPKKRVVRS